MAIDPTTTTTVKVSELASASYNTTDLIPHEVAGILKKGNLQDLATFIGGIISTEGAVGFRAVTVTDGQTLPATTEEEFILVGPGTYPNVGGGSAITTTEPLNALVSNGTYWFIGVEIPIGATGVWGTISGTLDDQTDLKDVLDLKADLVDGKVPSSQLPSYVDYVVEVANYAALPVSGETGKIYLTLDNNKIYRWSGSAYIEIADNNAVWGMITGTLSSQTDLNSALGLKVPYTGATGNVDLGSHKLTASDLVVNHTSGSGTAATISKGGNGEALTVTKSSGSGNVASFSGGVTSISELHLTTDLADAYIASAATWNAKQAALTFSSPLVNTSGTISIPVASGSANGYLSSTDWNTFNGKQSALNGTGFVKASGTTISYDNTTYVPTSRRLTINGTDYDLTADRSWTILSGAWGYISGTLSDQEDLQDALDLKATDASVVKITTDQNIRGIKTFLGNQTATTLKLIVADYYNDGIITSDNGMLRLLNGTTELFNLASTGDLTAKSFVKSGGTSSQYLMADGSVSTGSGGTVTGTGTTNYIPKFTGSSAIGNSSIFDDGTNVGIGIESQSDAKLYVQGALNIPAARFLRQASFGTVLEIGRQGYSFGASFGYPDDNNLSINTNSNERIRIFANGNTFIGASATDAGYKLDVNGTGRFSGTVTGISYGINRDSVFRGGLYSYKDIAGGGTDYGLTLFAESGSGNGNIYFCPAGSSTKAATLTTNGELLIGRTSSYGAGWQLAVEGNIYAKNDLRIDANASFGGSVGIGTASPSQILESVKSQNADTAIKVTNVDTGGAATAQFFASNGTETTQFFQCGTSYGTSGILTANRGGIYNTSSAGIGIVAAGAAGLIAFSTGGTTERMRITSGGNVGIGTTSPFSQGSGATTMELAGNTYGQFFVSANSAAVRGVVMARASTLNDVYIASITNSPLIFGTNDAERMRITSGGNVGIGTTSPAEKLDVSGAVRITGQATNFAAGSAGLNIDRISASGLIRIYGVTGTGSAGDLALGTNNTERMRIASTGEVTFTSTVTATGFFNSSDNRLKDLIDYDYNVSDIKPITYLWKDGRDNKKHVGYSAQEVQKVMPDAVNEDEKGMLSVNYVEVLVAKISQMENRIKQLEK